CERELTRLAVTAHLHIVRGALAEWHGLVRQVRKCEKAAVAPLLHRLELDLELFDPPRALATRFMNLRDVQTLPSRARDLVTRGVLFALETFELGQQAAAARFERRELIQLGRHVEAAFLQTSANGVELVSEECRIHHNQCALRIAARLARSPPIVA